MDEASYDDQPVICEQTNATTFPFLLPRNLSLKEGRDARGSDREGYEQVLWCRGLVCSLS